MKYKTKYLVKVEGNSPDFEFFAPDATVAQFYTEMCGFSVLSVQEISRRTDSEEKP